ncbi:TlpA disulfide reductase family protein [Spirosoma sp.]|uniref:TlpA family protein disulfide reductase n=1 Tax=Spirosoma sp. TaxID=1899569 RepID=UPI0026196883|nr:TlpA disulfide reductase family protein [Spirosoma sp.]MCX6216782.1 TlpA disulfide reductase family protein [Spirosoma sp.]
MNTTKKKQTSWLTYILWLGVIVLLFFTDLGTSLRAGIQGLILGSGLKNAPTDQPAAAAKESPVASEYPYQLSLMTLDNKQVSLSELKGKVVFLNQWATWCPPCRAEMPAIERLYQSLDKQKIAFVMLSLDEDPQTVRQAIQQKGFSFPVYTPASALPDDFATQAIPTTLILTRDGQIAQRIEGMANYDTDEFRRYLLSLYHP